MLCLCQPTPQDCVTLYRALHNFHVRHVPLRMHSGGPDAAYLEHLTDKVAAGGWLLGHDAGWGFVSYLLALPVPPKPGYLEHPVSVVQLDHLYVAPGFRGLGLGGALIDAFEHRLRREGVQHWSVGFHAFNSPAERLYRQAGAEPRAGYYGKRLV